MHYSREFLRPELEFDIQPWAGLAKKPNMISPTYFSEGIGEVK